MRVTVARMSFSLSHMPRAVRRHAGVAVHSALMHWLISIRSRCSGEVFSPLRAGVGASVRVRRLPFPGDVMVVAVRWYLRYGSSYRDVEELLAERDVEVDHVTVNHWVQRFTPLLAEAALFARHLPFGSSAPSAHQ